MHEAAAAPCPDCETPVLPDDHYCRHCGMFLAAAQVLPQTLLEPPTRALQVSRPGLPSAVVKVAAAVAVAAVFQVGAGLAGKYLATQAAKSMGLRASSKRRSGREIAPADDPLLGADAVTETFVYRRVWLRRG